MVLREYYKILKMSNLGLKKISVNILNERKQIHTGICCWFMNIRAQEYVPAGMCGGLEKNAHYFPNFYVWEAVFGLFSPFCGLFVSFKNF